MNDVNYDPDAGGVGYLTWDQWDRLTRAWQTAHKHLAWWWVAGHVRGGDAEERKTRSQEHALPLPATWLAAYEITRLMQELNKWPELEDAANDIDGADFALLLIREVETAAAKWPVSDRSHKVRHFRCQACDQMTLKYMPPNLRVPRNAPTIDVARRATAGPIRQHAVMVERPTLEQGRTVMEQVRLGRTVETVEIADVAVRCTDKACGAVMSHDMFEIAVAVIKQEQEARVGKRRLGESKSGRGAVRQVGADDPALGGDGSGEAVEAGA